MSNYLRKVNQTYLFGLIISYVAGIDVFVYLKMLGLKELNEVTADGQEALLPLSTGMALIIALGIAFLEFNVFNKWRALSLTRFIVYKYSIITFLVSAVSVFVFMLFALFVENKTLTVAAHTIPEFIGTEIFLSIFLYLLLFSIFLNMIKTISEYLGPQAIINALLGRYDRPAEEDLTFLFIDLRSSTRIAERMGHAQYSRFIGKSFQQLTESVYKHNATIYQFVGDEVVLLWPTSTAGRTLAPIRLYFDFIEKLKTEGVHFLREFGEIPQFKAAINTGLVTVTEIRTIKKDIVYHGDVLNTCARIMEQCGVFKKDLLVSLPVAEWIKDSNAFKATQTTELPLRGKSIATSIYEVTRVPSSGQML